MYDNRIISLILQEQLQLIQQVLNKQLDKVLHRNINRNGEKNFTMIDKSFKMLSFLRYDHEYIPVYGVFLSPSNNKQQQEAYWP